MAYILNIQKPMYLKTPGNLPYVVWKWINLSKVYIYTSFYIEAI